MFRQTYLDWIIRMALIASYLLVFKSTTLAQVPQYRPVSPRGAQVVRGTFTLDDLKRVPNAEDKESPRYRIAGSLKNLSVPAATASTDPSECDVPPATIPGNYQYIDSLYSTSAALKAGIPFLNVSGSLDQMVLVRDYMQAKDCLATDNKTRVFYGQAIRTVLTIADYDAKVGTQLSMLAADATFNHKNHQINIVIYGLKNPKFNDVIAQISSTEFSVETYGQYLQLQSNLIKLISDTGTTTSIERIGTVPNVDDSVLSSSAATAFALQQLANGTSCQKAQAAFHTPNDPSAKAIADTYNLITRTCDNNPPSDNFIKKARDLLLGLKVKY